MALERFSGKILTMVPQGQRANKNQVLNFVFFVYFVYQFTRRYVFVSLMYTWCCEKWCYNSTRLSSHRRDGVNTSKLLLQLHFLGGFSAPGPTSIVWAGWGYVSTRWPRNTFQRIGPRKHFLWRWTSEMAGIFTLGRETHAPWLLVHSDYSWGCLWTDSCTSSRETEHILFRVQSIDT